MPIALVIAVECFVTVRAVGGVASVRVMRVLLVALLPHQCCEDFVAEGAFEVAEHVYSFVILQPVPVNETHVALVADIVAVMAVHVLQQHLEGLEGGVAEGAVEDLAVGQLELEDVVVQVWEELLVVFSRQVSFQRRYVLHVFGAQFAV